MFDNPAAMIAALRARQQGQMAPAPMPNQNRGPVMKNRAQPAMPTMGSPGQAMAQGAPARGAKSARMPAPPSNNQPMV